MRRRPTSPRAASHRAGLIASLGLVLTLQPAVAWAADEATPAPTDVAAAQASPAPSAGLAPLDPPASPAPAETPWEPDFRVGDWELRKLPWDKRHLGGVALIPAKTIGPSDSKGVPLRPLGRGGRMVYNPTVLAQQGLKRLDAFEKTGKGVHRRVARNIADVLDDISASRKGRRWVPHRYRYERLRPGWVNANSHGLVLSFLSRYYELLGAEQRLQTAHDLLPAFEQREGDRRWISTVTEGGLLWLEHWPDGKHVHTLNAHLNAMFGLYDYWIQTGDPIAEQYILGAALTVREKLGRFRRKGRLSRYSLSQDLATVHYHRTHIDQLKILSRMTGDKWFRRQANQLQKDERRWHEGGRGRG